MVVSHSIDLTVINLVVLRLEFHKKSASKGRIGILSTVQGSEVEYWIIGSVILACWSTKSSYLLKKQQKFLAYSTSENEKKSIFRIQY